MFADRAKMSGFVFVIVSMCYCEIYENTYIL